jgi:iron complex outermembrane receptor protein
VKKNYRAVPITTVARSVHAALWGTASSRSVVAVAANSAALLFLAAPPTHAQQAAVGGPSDDQQPTIAEVVVTAQRRTQSLQDVPYNISALGSDALQTSGITSISGLSELVAGLTTVDVGPADRAGNNNFTLRGLRTDSPGGGSAGLLYKNLTVSPVSTYFGETPVFFQMPLDDIERVEVLRGPQGTLYGSGSQAGTIRFIPKQPEFGTFDASVTATGGYTQNAPSPNGDVHGMINIPLADALSLRIVAGEDHLAGFIKSVDRAALGADGAPIPSIPGNLTSGFTLAPVQDGINKSDQYFVRGTVRWEPTAAFHLQLGYLHENTQMADSQWGNPSWPGGPFDSSFGVYPNAIVNTRPGCTYCTTNLYPEPFSESIDLGTVVATLDLGFATVTSASSYYDDSTGTTNDGTGFFYGSPAPPNPNVSLFLPYFPYLSYPRLMAPLHQEAATHSFTQELRWVGSPSKIVDYVVGVYYQHELDTSDVVQWIPGINAFDTYIKAPNAAPLGDINYARDAWSKFPDKAIFGELTYHVTSNLQVTGGLRFFRQGNSSLVVNRTPLCGAICSADLINPLGEYTAQDSSTVSSHVKKINASYDFSPDLKVYATYSEGFRRGGVSGLPVTGPFASPPGLQTFKPDLAKNYEVGIKGMALDRRIRYFADIYLVDLDNFQFDTLNISGNPGGFNGKTARSQGFELESDAAISENLSMRIGYAFTRAYVKDSFNILDYLPYALVPSLGGTGQTASLFGGPLPGGTSLPGVPRHSVTMALDYSRPSVRFVDRDWTPIIHVEAAYRSSEHSNIDPASIYEFTIPWTFVSNARFSLATSSGSSVFVYVNNITNDPQISGGIYDQEFKNLYALQNVGRPRTYGIGVHYAIGK